MLHHIAIEKPEGGGYVAYYGGLGLTSVLDCPTMEAAQGEANRLNLEQRIACANRPRRVSECGPRRSVRHFENEDVHG